MYRQGKKPVINPTHIGTKEFYNAYADGYFRKYPEGRKNGVLIKDSIYYLTIAQYTSLLDEINQSIVNNLIHNNLVLKLPLKLGELSIRKFKPRVKIVDGKVVNGKAPNWDATIKLWESDEDAKLKKKIIRQENKETNGFTFIFFYQKKNAYFTNKLLYKFRACRTANIMLRQALKDNPELDYYLT